MTHILQAPRRLWRVCPSLSQPTLRSQLAIRKPSAVIDCYQPVNASKTSFRRVPESSGTGSSPGQALRSSKNPGPRIKARPVLDTGSGVTWPQLPARIQRRDRRGTAFINLSSERRVTPAANPTCITPDPRSLRQLRPVASDLDRVFGLACLYEIVSRLPPQPEVGGGPSRLFQPDRHLR